MKYFYFIENKSGKEFIVSANNYKEAEEIARDISKSIVWNCGEDNPSIEFQYEMSEEVADASGLDEY